MREHARRSRLAEEPLAHAVDLFGLAIVPEMDRLDGHRTADVRVDRMVHHTHGAAAQFPDNLIAPDTIHSTLVIAHAWVVPSEVGYAKYGRPPHRLSGPQRSGGGGRQQI